MICPKCGAEGNGAFCEFCGQSLQLQQEAPDQNVYSDPAEPQQSIPVQEAYEQPQEATYVQPVDKPENVVTGAVGALLGAVLGGVAIILISQLGFVAAISGLILAVCTLKGYELLGNKLSTKGVIICVVLMLITPYIADRIDWALMLVNEVGSGEISFAEAFAAVPELVAMGYAEGYWGNLIMLYLFAILGGAATVWNTLKKK